MLQLNDRAPAHGAPSDPVAASPEPVDPAEDFTARNRLVITILIVSAFVVILNETIMAVALPRLMDALGVSANAVQWLTTAFLLTMATVIPVTGFLIQRIDTRPLFLMAMSLFAFGTLCAALSPNLYFLIAARIVQALGTAIMMPLLMTTVMTLVPPDRRGPVMGNISLVISVAPAIGPAISGIVLYYLPWPFLFWLVLPIALAALAFGALRIQNVTQTRYAPLDYLSVPLSAVAFGGLVYGLSGFGVAADATPAIPPVYAIGIGALAMAAFVWRQFGLQRRDGALLDFRTLTARNYRFGLAVLLIVSLALFGTIILLPIYMQNVLGIDTLQTGLMLLPGGLLMGLLGPQVGKLYDRIGPRPLIVPGAIVVSGVLWALTFLTTDTSIWAIFAGHLAFSIGLAFMFTPLFTVSLSSVKPELYSHGSALLGSSQQVAAAAGVALFVAILSARSAGLLAEGVATPGALTGGITAAFTVGAVISMLGIGVALFIRRAPVMQGVSAHH